MQNDPGVCTKAPFLRWLVLLTTIAAPLLGADDDASRQAYEQYLRRYPEADTDGDGVLGRQELNVHQSKLQKARSLEELGGRVRLLEDIIYATVDGRELKLDLYLPRKPLAEAGRPPLVLWFHGGAWQWFSKDRCMMIWLAAEGYALASVDYRLAPCAKFPAQIHDCKGAVRWLRANSEKFGYSVERIAAIGESAGGHLASLLGTSAGVTALEGTVGGNLDHSSRVDAVINFYAPIDLAQWTRERGDPNFLDVLFGGTPETQAQLFELASPLTHITPDDTPALIVHGDKDADVSIWHSRQLHKQLAGAGVPTRLHIIEGAVHTGPPFTDARRRALVLEFLLRWIGPGVGGT